MSINVSQMIEGLGGSTTLDAVGHAFGLSRSQVSAMIDSVAPMLIRGLQHRTATDEGLASFRAALQSGNHGRYIDNPSSVRTEEAREDGSKILGHIFPDHGVKRDVAAAAANRTGIDTSVIEKALPILAGVIMGAMSKRTDAGRELAPSASQSHALGPLAAMFDLDRDGQVLDDIIGMASRYIGQ